MYKKWKLNMNLIMYYWAKNWHLIEISEKSKVFLKE